VERWLRAADVTDGTRAKVKCVMSALFSHAVRWEFCGHNPFSSGILVESGGKRGPSSGVRVSARRQQAPLFLSPEQVKLGLTKLEFRDQLLVFLDGALGTRRGELGALRWSDCNFDSMSFSVQHSYYWRRGGHLKATKMEASATPALGASSWETSIPNSWWISTAHGGAASRPTMPRSSAATSAPTKSTRLIWAYPSSCDAKNRSLFILLLLSAVYTRRSQPLVGQRARPSYRRFHHGGRCGDSRLHLPKR
jgi:hypothetical protein